jgi:hypothetical protein
MAMRFLAQRIRHLEQELMVLGRQLDRITQAIAPDLRAAQGIGPDNAAALLIAAGDNPQRLRSEAAFAELCGASPIPASSGTRQRHRLNRGGNSQANCSLFRIALNRLRWDPATKAYAERRTAEGKSKREILRCLKTFYCPGGLPPAAGRVLTPGSHREMKSGQKAQEFSHLAANPGRSSGSRMAEPARRLDAIGTKPRGA